MTSAPRRPMSSTRFIPKLIAMLLQVWVMTMVGERPGAGYLSPRPPRSRFSRFALPPVRLSFAVGAAPGPVVGQRVAARAGVEADLRQQLAGGRGHGVEVGIEEHGRGLLCGCRAR